jgi:serine/threonine protein kinase
MTGSLGTGSFNYASPELLLGVRGISYSTDIFSFGVLLWYVWLPGCFSFMGCHA